MKKIRPTITVLTLTLLCRLSSSAISNTIYYGVSSNALNIVFEDNNLPKTNKSMIVTDIQRCLLEWGKNSEMRLREKEDSIGYFYNSDECPSYPGNIKFPKDIVLASAGKQALLVSQKLSDFYTNAFVFASVNSNIVTAGYQFVSFMSSTNFNKVTPENISNYVYYNEAPPLLYQVSFTDITNNLCYPTYYPPSLLGFYYSPKGPAATNLWMLVPGSTKMFGNTEWSSFPAIWHDNRWKFCVWEDNPNYRLPPDLP